MEEESPSQWNAPNITPGQVLAMLRMQWPVVVGFAITVVLVTLAMNLRADKVYQATASVKVTSRLGEEYSTAPIGDYDYDIRASYIATQLQILESRDVTEEVVKRYMAVGYNSPEYRALGFDELTLANGGPTAVAAMLTASQRGDTDLVDITIRCGQPQECAVLANLVAEAFADRTLDERQQRARGGIAWATDEIAQAQERIRAGNDELIAYQREHDLADADQELTSLGATLDTLTNTYADVHTERVLLETTVKAHQKLFDQKRYDDVAKDMATPSLADLLGEYASAQNNHGEMRAKYKGNHPDLALAQKNVDGVFELLHLEVGRELSAEKARLDVLIAKEGTLDAAVSEQKKLLLDRKAVFEEYSRRVLELDLAKDQYSTLVKRHDDLVVASHSQLSNVGQLDDARPNARPIAPNIPSNLFVALLVGLVGGVALALLREFLDDRIASPLDVEAYLRVPFLGAFPKLATSDDRERALYVHKNPRSPATEAMRAMRTVIELDPTGKPMRRLLVTSSISSEGKTSTSINLGVSFANLGKRVLVIDADLRRPRLHTVFDVPREHGLSTACQGDDLSKCIHPTEVPGLTVMPAGPSVERPNELLASRSVAELLDEMQNQYDIVIIDSSPCAMLSDAQILAKYADGVIVVVREHTVSRNLVREVISRLRRVNANIIGVVLNGVDIDANGSRYQYYYYSYYGYRYRYYEKYYEESDDAAAK